MIHRRIVASSIALLLSAGFAIMNANCDSPSLECTPGYEKCTCAANNSCLSGLTCLSGLCVNTSGTTAASTSTGDTTASSTAATGTGGGGTGGGATGTGGAASSSSSTTTASGTGGGQTGECAPNVIDDFSSCDANICNVNGRSGMWHTVLDSASSEQYSLSMPPAPWNDMTCAAWTQGGPGGAYAGFGTQLANGGPYDLSAWGGITVLLESSHDVWLQLKAVDGGVFQVNVPGMDGTSTNRSIRFSDLQYVGGTGGSSTLDLKKITDLQLMAHLDQGFGYAVHKVVLDN